MSEIFKFLICLYLAFTSPNTSSKTASQFPEKSYPFFLNHYLHIKSIRTFASEY